MKNWSPAACEITHHELSIVTLCEPGFFNDVVVRNDFSDSGPIFKALITLGAERSANRTD
jgi:hypothetical protein